MQVGRRPDERTECGRGIMDGHLLDSFAQCDVGDGLGLRQARRRSAEQTRRRQGMIGGLRGILARDNMPISGFGMDKALWTAIR